MAADLASLKICMEVHTRESQLTNNVRSLSKNFLHCCARQSLMRRLEMNMPMDLMMRFGVRMVVHFVVRMMVRLVVRFLMRMNVREVFHDADQIEVPVMHPTLGTDRIRQG